MIRISGTIAYLDGRSDTFEGGPREWVAWERYALSHGLPTVNQDPSRAAGLTMTWFLAYQAATRHAAERPGFEEWLDGVADIAADVAEAPPTRPAASAATSSSSGPPSGSIPAGSPNGTPETSRLSPTS